MLELETQNPPPAPPSNWLVGHPYAASTIGAVLLFLIGAYIVLSNSLASPPPPSVSAWGGTVGSLLEQNEYLPSASHPTEDIVSRVQDSPPYTYKIPPLTPDPAAPTQSPQTDNRIDLQALIDSIGDSGTSIGAPQPKWSSVIYEFPPSNIFSSTETPAARTELQQKLYNYGNEVGSYIQSYEQQNRNQTTVLKDQLEDRGSPEKAEAVVQIGHALQNVGKNMRGIDDVPPEIAEAHQALIDSYTEIGYNLTLVPAAQNAQEFMSAINLYNKSADLFAEKFVDMVQVFSKHSVVFSTSDSGMVFTFTFTTDN